MEIVKAFNTNKLHTEIVIKGTIEEPLFRANDIGEILEISTIRNSIADYDETEKVSIISQTNGGNQSVNFLHLCTFKTPIINIFSLGFSEFYSLEHIFHFYYKHLPKCSYNILLV